MSTLSEYQLKPNSSGAANKGELTWLKNLFENFEFRDPSFPFLLILKSMSLIESSSLIKIFWGLIQRFVKYYT